MKKGILLFCLVFTSCGLFAQSMTPKDAQFTMDAVQAGLLEIKLGELSITRASSNDVKILGQHMIVDYTKSNDELKAVAVTKNITLPEWLSNDGQFYYDSLSKKSGVDFDKVYCSIMVKDHIKTVAMFKEEAANGSDIDLKNWSSITLPVLENHLVMSKDVNAKINGKK